LPPEICNMIFFKVLNSTNLSNCSRWMKMRKGVTFLCYKNELEHKQLLLIVFGM
jgi:hypothetical protein